MRTPSDFSARRPAAAIHAKRTSDRAGFTIVELLIAAAIGLIVLLGAGSLYLGTVRSFQVGSKKLVAQQEATLLSTVINHTVRSGSAFTIYNVLNPGVPSDSGDGLAIRDSDGASIGRIEWNSVLATLVDSTGNRITAMSLRDVQFRVDPAAPRTVYYRYKTDDENGNLVDIESGATLRN